MKERKLTRKEAHFVAELDDPKITQRDAAIRAGFSARNADSIASRLVKKSQVLEAIEKKRSERLRKIGVRADRVLTEIARVAFSDLRKLYKEDGSLKLPGEWSDEAAAAVAGVEVFEEFSGRGEDRTLIGHTKKVRSYDKVKALELLSKHLGIIGNGKHHDEEAEEGDIGRMMTPLELSAKMFFYLELVMRRSKEIEAQKALSGKSQDEKPKELLK
jgi:phage terminase small subunit